jgi:hypothetical protein
MDGLIIVRYGLHLDSYILAGERVFLVALYAVHVKELLESRLQPTEKYEVFCRSVREQLGFFTPYYYQFDCLNEQELETRIRELGVAIKTALQKAGLPDDILRPEAFRMAPLR